MWRGFDPADNISVHEVLRITTSLRFSSNSEASATELLENVSLLFILVSGYDFVEFVITFPRLDRVF